MDLFHAVVLAILQGLTEFLPISSSAHLILVPELLGWPDQGLAFDVAVHVGTLLAVVLFLMPEIRRIVPAWLVGWGTRRWNADGQLGWLVILATIPVGLVGLLLGDWIELNLRSALVIAASTLVFGLLLGWADRGGDRNQRQMTSLGWKHTLLVGAAQALALIPGTSRSGITMTALLALGYTRTAAARFSFLMAVPAIALPGLLKTMELTQQAASADWYAIAVGVVVSATVAFLCMKVFMRFVERVGMLPFVIYRILLSLVIVGLMV
ncbi:undecaprenyl-diphosphatase [Arenicella chitinivorans]|uniref:Undecaprenyl-diphosphatase n=1 Tax=Arenicella chitinivorans TaxID=1329800 RepID=A0A918S0T2_9GAMM|nr:undecaprenyl-diphosphate phosphatase [Arenicella chitinivorans]GHA19788.1 undecaprenyl-diphosphatase [Arenicella chitinivorans]